MPDFLDFILQNFKLFQVLQLFRFQTWPLYFETFYGRNLRNFVISKSVCPWQAFPA
jgi:hypothetical protein